MARYAREIKVKKSELSNDNVSVHIGAMEQKGGPSTIYVSMGFWTRPTEKMIGARAALMREIDACYRSVEEGMEDEEAFPDKDNNIFIVNMPENFAYNEKRNYVNLELYLHTRNVGKVEKVPLIARKENMLYGAALRVAEGFLGSELMRDGRGFEVRRSNK